MWDDTNAVELSRFVSLIIYMGVYPCPRLTDYWNSSGPGPVYKITKCMSLIRFEQLKRYVHICDTTGDNGSYYFFDKMEPLWSAVREASKS